MTKTAHVSYCGNYRYTLTRTWESRPRVCAFIGLNPSTADATQDDPTIRKCIGFAKKWGYGGIVMLNLYAWRATKPADLFKAQSEGKDVVGPENSLQYLLAYLRYFDCSRVIAAWGKNGGGYGIRVKAHVHGLMYLRLNGDGSPAHPLYIPYDVQPQPFPLPEAK